MASPHPNLASVGVLAARTLADACRADGGDLCLDTVRGLAEDLGRRLASLSSTETPDSPVETMLACADLATLAACNLGAVPRRDRPLAVAATHLAAGNVRALLALVEAEPDGPGTARAENTLRDARSAGWKADLAVRQLSGGG